MPQCPGRVIGPVRGKAEFATGPQHPRDRSDAFRLHEASFPMPPLRPGIRVDQVEASNALVGQPWEDLGGVAVVQPNIGETALIDGRQRLRHAIDEGLDSDEADVRVTLRLRDEMLAPAEPALQMDLADAVEERARVRGRGFEIERKPRQQGVEQSRLPRLERVPLATAEERARLT